MNFLRFRIGVCFFLKIAILAQAAFGAVTIYYPEPFDFHYPDETTHANISDRVWLQATLGEYESGTFVVHSSEAAANVGLRAGHLRGPNGQVLAQGNTDLGIVTFMSRESNDIYLHNIWVGGLPAGQGLEANYNGFNQDAKDRLPLLPVCIVKDDAEFEAAKSGALGHITLTHQDNVTTSFDAGKSKQFWITVYIPEDLDLTEMRTVFSTDIELVVDGDTSLIPLEVEVINYRLDKLGDHERYLGVMRAWDVGSEFRNAAMADIRAHGCNALRAPLNAPADYDYVKSYGFDLAITTETNWTANEVQEIRDSGYLPLMYGRDEPGKPPDPGATILEHIQLTEQIHTVGGLAGTSGAYDVLEEIAVTRGVSQDWWLMGMSTRSWYASQWLTDLAATLTHLEDLRKDPENRIALLLEGSYEGIMNGHYPLLTRIMYGFWLYNSNLDLGIHWGYATDAQEINPYTTTDAFMVAFPATIVDQNDDFLRREMIPSYTWEAFREGIDDLKFALTIDRLINEIEDAAYREQQRIQFDTILNTFKLIDVNNEHQIRIDAYNGYAGTRTARTQLIDILTEICMQEEITVNFTATPTTGTAPLQVDFADMSFGYVTNWSWDFDNDLNVDSDQQNPTHSYSDPGIYSVRLEVMGPKGSDLMTRSEYITVREAEDPGSDDDDSGDSGNNGLSCFIITTTY